MMGDDYPRLPERRRRPFGSTINSCASDDASTELLLELVIENSAASLPQSLLLLVLFSSSQSGQKERRARYRSRRAFLILYHIGRKKG